MTGKFSPVNLLCTFFLIGHLPKASGTAASFVALFPAWIIISVFGNPALALFAVLLLLVGTPAVKKYLTTSASKDPKEVVIDEVVGQWLTLSMLPLTPRAFLVGFVLFRFFDIIKPWPVSYFDRKFKNATGVMMDDVVAGIYPAAIIIIVGVITGFTGSNFDVMEYVSNL